ncbi:YIEGIA family protein [Paenibacillus larvae]|uniref:YIEGIA protein n=2 Tax=Paenibacillus larvae TaxID=1464 RepID=A0A2L1TYK4_9BACL|nr:YIEGIA family protein [Paenibacillus larvae]AQT86239.1 hypothetical protein B1222_20355 [Paenibacillus larvae subsp. pulvifaciens]AQZ47868.1 hypothetical protein B5S25_16025 [Paenibacillus larvae subsp. pulvifaciens]AVF25761.1 hypothetical protein ERICIII_01575 [Paenibacillus larvae subsp. larvae]MBH0341956.1 membrane protein [Paenibacillus larvae]MCY7519266.1 YIEGIA family protein [Paenibacillus larvae]
MFSWLINQSYIVGIIIGVLFGVTARIQLLRTDYRQYPTYPHGKVIHMALGVIAAGLGAVAVPALLNKDYTAVTFLTVAAQQFRDVRNMERQSLMQIDSMELVPRGAAYIEGIAMVFEGRNYLVIFTAFMASLFSIMFHWYWGIAVGIAALAAANLLKSGKSLAHIADVVPVEVRLEGPDLYVDSIYIMNVGLDSSREIIKKKGIGLLIKPKNKNSRVTIANIGQRQAILHDASTILGVYRDTGEPALIPMAKLDLETGILGVLLLPQDKDEEKAAEAVRQVPILESAVRLPSESSAQHKSGGRSE